MNMWHPRMHTAGRIRHHTYSSESTCFVASGAQHSVLAKGMTATPAVVKRLDQQCLYKGSGSCHAASLSLG